MNRKLFFHEQQSVLVTGGAGFIGSHVAAALRASGRRVEVLDNLSVGHPARVPAGVRFHLGDVRSEPDLQRIFGGRRFDAVVHCAAQTSVERSMKEPRLDREINVDGTKRLAAVAEAWGVKQIIFASSGGAIYGESTAAATEATSPAPRSFYGRHKHEAERLLLSGRVPCAVLRLSNVYGPGQRSDAEGGVVAIFLERLAAGDALELHGGGSQVRDFVHVSDVVKAAILALDDGMTGVWNVAGGRATSIVGLVEELAALTGRTMELRHLPRRAGDVDCSLIDSTKLQATGWGPPLPLADGLRLTLAASGVVVGSEAVSTTLQPA
jgi:UDP-glucose 4-epimerase